MATRICFTSTPDDKQIYKETEIDFTYFSGFALSQKQKCIESMHESILKRDKSLKVLEISTKSTNPLGVALSAFNLKFYDKVSKAEFPIENVFQSSKVFELGGPFNDLLYASPKDAKRDERLKTSGMLKEFRWNNQSWPLNPKTMFYDWIYISSLAENAELAEHIMHYNAFTDIEFNHKKSINCQARAAAIFVSLRKNEMLNRALGSKEFFERIYAKP